MKCYIFITTFIRYIGGGHIYTVNKMKYLQSLGWNTYFFHANVGDEPVYVKDLERYVESYDTHLQFSCFLFSRKEREEVINRLCTFLPQGHDIQFYIESQTLNCSTWGELLAKRINGRHIIFYLSEHGILKNLLMLNFYKFKLDRKELFGITNKTLSNLFGDNYLLKQNERYTLIATCSNSLADISCTFLAKIPKADFVIGSIGRINKPFLPCAVDDIVTFAKKYNDKSFLVILIGASCKGIYYKKISSIIKKQKNVSLYVTGEMYPIPVSLVKYPQVFISSSGSCLTSSQLGKITISYDGNDFKPIGILGYTTKNVLFRDPNEKVVPLSTLLEAVLIKKEYLNRNIEFIEEKITFPAHLECLSKTQKDKRYFDFYSCNNLSIKEQLINWTFKIMGFKLGYEIILLKRKIFNIIFTCRDCLKNKIYD